MNRLLVLLLLWSGTAAARDMCNDAVPMTLGDRPQMLSPMVEVADDVLRADLAAGDGSADPLEAIRHYLEHYFYMKHPQANTPAAFSRCAPAEMYSDLTEAVARRVDAVANEYRSSRRFLSDQDNGYPAMEEARPGLLRLRVLAHQYDAFEREARDFLLAAKDDPQAADYFRQVLLIVNSRAGELENFQQAVDALESQGFNAGQGLMAYEQQGLSRLRDLPSRIDALREAHVQHWLDLEAQDWEEVRDNPPGAVEQFMTLMPAVMSSITRLEQGVKVGLPADEARLHERALTRGDWLTGRDRHEEAIPYFEFAEADDKAARAQEIVDDRLAARAEQLETTIKAQLGDMLKSDEEQEAFESETDALADELGIDLDDF